MPGGKWYSTNHFFHTRAPGTYFTYSNMCFGILATILEKLSGERFDLYMRHHVLLPMNVNASYLLWDVPVNEVSVLYRNGKAQADDYKGVMPPAPDLTGYIPGTNAFKFSPHAGLKISAHELAIIHIMFYNQGMHGNTRILKAETIKLMRTTQWIYNGTNGDNVETAGPLMDAWGLGT